MKPTTNIIIDTRRALKTGKYPIKLRVTFRRKQRYFATDYNLSPTEFQAVMASSPRGTNKEIKLNLQALEGRANEIINKLGLFSFEKFSQLLYSDQLLYETVFTLFEKKIDSLKSSLQFGTSSSYQCSLNSLRAYRPNLTFGEITVEFLNGYENWLLSSGKSVTTVGIYLRPLRAILNLAKEEGTLPADYKYPFGLKSKGKYQIPATRSIKKALGKDVIKKIFEYKPEPGTWEEKALDYWIFIYLGNGMNMMDLATLKFSNIDGDYIRFVRQKTKRSASTTLPISVFIQDKMKEIIERQGNPVKNKEDYIFPIITVGEKPEKQRALIQQMTKMVNRYMGRIAKTLDIDKKITTYTARHSFSTVLKRSGINIQNISEALGHNSVSTTKSYLDSFDDESKKEMAKLLMSFE